VWIYVSPQRETYMSIFVAYDYLHIIQTAMRNLPRLNICASSGFNRTGNQKTPAPTNVQRPTPAIFLRLVTLAFDLLTPK